MNNKIKTFAILVITLMVAAIAPSFIYASDTCLHTRGHWQHSFFNYEEQHTPITRGQDSTLVVEEHAIHYGDLSFTKHPDCLDEITFAATTVKGTMLVASVGWTDDYQEAILFGIRDATNDGTVLVHTFTRGNQKSDESDESDECDTFLGEWYASYSEEAFLEIKKFRGRFRVTETIVSDTYHGFCKEKDGYTDLFTETPNGEQYAHFGNGWR